MSFSTLKQWSLKQPSAKSEGYSSAVSSLLYHRGGQPDHQETKSGSYIYRGDAASFHEWQFRTCMKVAGADNDNYARVMSQVVEGLRGDAFIVAKTIGFALLQSPGGARVH